MRLYDLIFLSPLPARWCRRLISRWLKKAYMDVTMKKEIVAEAERCLQCKRPQCRKGCPLGTPINEMVKLLLEGKMEKAGALLFENNPLSIICSMICPHENFCEGHCVLGRKGNAVRVSSIENYISSNYIDRFQPVKPSRNGSGDKTAVIGSGPAGITVALILALQGYDVTIFESEEKIGGILEYGIPEFRLPKDRLKKLKALLLHLGVKIRPNALIGPVITIDNLLRDNYRAIFIGTGVWNPKPLGINGETLGHVHYAIHYLKNSDTYALGRKVAVIGAGNVAMDTARTALRNGAEEVTVLYRRGEDDMPATRREYRDAREDGVHFEFYRSPLEITDEGVVFTKTGKETENDGTTRISAVKGSEALFKADSVFIAVSQSPRSNIVENTAGIEIGNTGLVITDDSGRTTRDGVFASGDVVTGAKTVAEAVHVSKRSAHAMMEYLENLNGSE